jgi:hypothetical protein
MITLHTQLQHLVDSERTRNSAERPDLGQVRLRPLSQQKPLGLDCAATVWHTNRTTRIK